MDNFWTIFFVLILIIVVVGIIMNIYKNVYKQKNKTKEHRPYRETPDNVLMSEYKNCLKELAALGTKNISSWMEQQAVQSSVDRIEASLSMYANELKARGYKIDYSDYKNVKFRK